MLNIKKDTANGFTLIELMVTVAVLAIVIAVAIPSFTTLVNNNRLTAQANELLAGLILARTEAIKQNQSMVFCHSVNGTECSAVPVKGWQGWLVHGTIDNTPLATGIIQSANMVVLSSKSVTDAVISGVGNSVRFTPQGLLRSGSANNPLNGVVRVCLPSVDMDQNARDLVLRSGGRSRVNSNSVANTCPAPSNPV